MAEYILPVFDVVRGWSGGGSLGSAYDRTFTNVQDGSGNPLKVKQGIFMNLVSTGALQPVNCAVSTLKTDYLPYLIVEGNDPMDSFSGDYLNKVVGIRGTYECLLSSSAAIGWGGSQTYNMFVAGAYQPGAAVTIINGYVNLWSSTYPKMGYVTDYNSAAGTLKLAFSL